LLVQVDALDGLSYSTPYIYTTMGFTGVPLYVNCTDANLKTFEECSDVRICANEYAGYATHILSSVPQQNLVIATTGEESLSNFLKGRCNVVATESAVTTQAFIRSFGYTGELTVSQKQHSHYKGALNSLDADPEWADFLNAVTMALLSAESSGITKEAADQIGQTALFGVTYQDMLINAIKFAGNFGDIYDLPVPRTGRNMANNGSSGMLASPPLSLEYDGDHGHSLREDGTIASILERGFLVCGIRGDRPGFAMYNVSASEWEGLDVSFCRLLASSLFSGHFGAGAVDFLDLSDTNGFEALHTGAVDVLAGAVWTLENDFREPITNVGYSFSQPYFYGPLNDKRYVTCC
jgi:ABC-type amino acid transport substrate-binding protein